MALSDELPLFWHVQLRFLIPHVFLVQILSPPGRGRVSWPNRRLHRHVGVRGELHGAARAVDLGAFPWKQSSFHDGVCVGEKERRGPDVLSGPVPLHGAVPGVGAAGVLDGDGQSPYY